MANSLVISYCRFSTAEQIKGDSMRRQEQMALTYCKKHGLKLTENLADKGISAFRGKNLKEGKLASFLELVEQQKVPQGSILIIEELDRLSRARPEKSLLLFLRIIEAGVTVITLADNKTYTKGAIDQLALMGSVMQLCLAHGESKKKSDRLLESRVAKRQKAAQGIAVPNTLPKWIKFNKAKGTYEPDGVYSQVVKYIFNLVEQEDLGAAAIAGRINNEKLLPKPIGKSYVLKILHNESVIGTYQPTTTYYDENDKRKSKPVGDPIEGYYPEVITPTQFRAVKRILGKRRHSGGAAAGQWVNIFQNLMNTKEGNYITATNKGNRSSGRLLVDSALVRRGQGGVISFPSLAMELAVLRILTNDIYTAMHVAKPVDLEPIKLDIEAKQKKLKDIKKAMLQNDDISSFADILIATERELKELQRELEEEQGKTTPTALEHAALALKELLGNMNAEFKAGYQANLTNLIAKHANANANTLLRKLANFKPNEGENEIDSSRSNTIIDALQNVEQRTKIKALLKKLLTGITASFSKNGVICNAEVVLHAAGKKPIKMSLSCHRNHPEVVEVIINNKILIVDNVDTCNMLAQYRKANASMGLDGRNHIIVRRKIQEALAKGKAVKQIAQELGLNVSSVYKMREVLSA